ncbi:MAG: hypothetical protein KC613_20995 [Myxococcales bacterium]|nr:hypothetical protein [Myxococcales bacterium]MCB9522288.1 hypothetical protein [Myxococcales bacterium]
MRARYWAAVVLLFLVGCADETGVIPPKDVLYYPLGLAAHPDGRYLYVTNAVFDRRYNTGTLTVYDTEARQVVAPATVPLGLFAGEIRLWRGEDGIHGVTVTRENGQVMPFRLGDDPQAADHIQCYDPAQASYGRCQADSGFLSFGVDGSPVASDPLGLALTPAGFVVTHAGNGVVSEWALDVDGAVRFDCQRNLPAGATSVARHPVLGWLYVTDRFNHRIQLVEPRPTALRDPEGVDTAPCELRNRGTLVVDPDIERGRTRGIAFSADGSLMYVASSSDRTLRIYDTSVGPAGTPRNTLLGAVPVGIQPNVVRVAGLRPGECRVPLRPGTAPGTCDRSDAAGDGLVYVTAFGDDRVVVLDPATLAVVARIEVGQGPHDIAFLPDADGRLRGYVSNFEVHSLSVLDLEPGSPARFTRIATID